MHVSLPEFRPIRRDGVTLFFAVLGNRAWVVGEFPASGSEGTFAEAPCALPHWGFTISGDVALDLDGQRHPVPPGTAFHVPAGLQHRVVAGPHARTAALEPIGCATSLDDESLRRAGFDIARLATPLSPGAVAIAQARPGRSPAAGEILAEFELMGELLLTRARLGRRAGYTSQTCDQPHWGVVTHGSIAIEWEDDVEIVGAGDVFHCPAGPPGHRIEAAERAAILDFTPIDAIRLDQRVADWRATASDAALAATSEVDGARIGLAALG